MGPNLAKALVAAQADLKNPSFDKANTAFGAPRGYASLASHVDTLRLPLAKHGLAVVQLVGTEPDGRLSLRTVLMHSSGDSIESHVSVSMPATEQKVGSALTYLRRYALAAIVGVCGDEDDDGNVASAPTRRQEASERPQAASGRPTATDAPKAVHSGVERALAGKPSDQLRVTGTVQRIWENEKTTRVVLESGESIKCFNDLPGLEQLALGKTYEFTCKPSNNPKYPDPIAFDFEEVAAPSQVAAPGQGGEEIPF